MTPPPAGRVAWITGAGTGIGRGLAQRLAGQGWTVAASARTAEDLESLAEACAPGRIRPYPLDVTDLAATEAVARRIEAELGPLSLAVLNAGTHVPVTVANFSVAALRKLVETNLMGTTHVLAQVMPSMVARGAGQIAIVASVAGYRGLPTAAGYGATKAGLINLCEALKPDLERHGVRLQVINPGFVDTPLTRRNDHPMPFIVPVEEAVDAIVAGLESARFEIVFPWRMALAMRLLRLLPDRVFFSLTRRMLKPAIP